MRDAIIIFIAIILAMVIGSYLFFNGASDITKRPQVPGIERVDESVLVLAEGQNSGEVERRVNYRIMNDEELTELWGMVFGSGGSAVPAIDFNDYEVIAVFDGSHSSGGYGVSVTDVKDEDGQRTIRIRHESPGDGCITTEAITSPFQIVRVSKTGLPIVKVEENTTRTCS